MESRVRIEENSKHRGGANNGARRCLGSDGYSMTLDFHLTQRNGVNCLSRIRQYDSLVSMIAVSGTATYEIAAVPITVRADDYLAMQALDSRILGQSVRNVLTRAQAFQSRFVAIRN
ncbi:hypothetical protein ETAA8_12650 [Anatilimnocola aggregata]|uniref:Uncharacterized protein n=1 Tax=Anatilimnocola aggregata TaxID=2528021 RepID=A0A517Y7H6_9BACT|nr:hypothetical protein ETAA8_12650 [Anatilimnocola aggregata]